MVIKMKEIYRTEPVEIPEPWQRRYGMPENMSVIVQEVGRDYRIGIVTPIFSPDAVSLIETKERPLGYGTKGEAVEAADQWKNDLAEVVLKNFENERQTRNFGKLSKLSQV